MSVLQELQSYTFTSKYARWLPEKKRRETWKEAIDRVRNMMLKKYKEADIDDEINWAYDMMLKKKVLGSQRALQYGGKPIEKCNLRIYNCLFSYCDRLRFFQECFYALLCGSGCGYSVQRHHVNKLPKIYKPHNGEKRKAKTYKIPDTIEGWADALGVLLSAYFAGGEWPDYLYTNVRFDYSLIRPEGSYLSSGVGKAPGPEPLRHALEDIRNLLDRCYKQERLRPIDAHDIIMFAADAVLSGGVRRSSCISIFSPDDQDMLAAKTGNWMDENPQRARSNNSALLLRDKTTFEKFNAVFKFTKEFGEPGFVWSDNVEFGMNPCQPKWAKLLTKKGIREFWQVKIGDEIWSKEGWTTIIKKWSTGINEVYKFETTSGIFYGTKNHKLCSRGEKIEARFCENIDIITGPDCKKIFIDPEYVMDGLVLGDGSVHKASNNLIYLTIGIDDNDYFESEVSGLIKKERSGISLGAYEIQTNIKAGELPYTYERYIPKRYFYENKHKVCSLLRGIYSANGSVCNNRITLKSSSKMLIEDVQTMLSSVGIRSYYTKNKPTEIEFNNGKYICKESFDLNITTDRDKFMKYIGFIQEYKNNKIKLIQKRKPKEAYDIINIELISIEETFDISVDNVSHTYWTQGCNVSNCAEVGMYAYHKGKSGWQGCNLSEINCATVEGAEDFYDRCKAASIIGTLQAGYTDFPYLGGVSEQIFRREALLGVSMTGIMEKPDIILDPKVQKKGANIVKKINEKIANKIGINSAARTTLVKPSGTASSVLGTSAGIHPHHAKRYTRHVQANRNEEVYQYFNRINPQACEKSVWSSNDTDDVILFPIEIPDGSKTKNDLPALEMLKIIRDTQINWVVTGKRDDLCVKPWLQHNVSNTVIVKDEEWEDVARYIYNNRQYFTAVSLLSNMGDKDFPQAPFTKVLTSREIVREYGDASIWCSGLIELALQGFDGDLWKACDVLIKNGKEYFLEKKYKSVGEMVSAVGQVKFIEKAKKFAEKYFEGDIRRLTYCLKDVHSWKKYCDLKQNFKEVDYTALVEEEDNTTLEQEIACQGGACLI